MAIPSERRFQMRSAHLFRVVPSVGGRPKLGGSGGVSLAKHTDLDPMVLYMAEI